MELTKNIISLRKGYIVSKNDGMDNRIAVATVQSHLMGYGYMLDEQAFVDLSKSDLSFISNFNNEIISYLRDTMGGKRNYTPLYKNFPQEVMSKSDFELYINAITHYWSNGTWEPSTVTYEKEIKFEKIKYTYLSSISEDNFNEIFKDLISINTSLSPQDIEVVKWFISNNEELSFPDVIPFKENLCVVFGKMLECGKTPKFQNLKLTTTDVLRLAVYLSGGDVSLPKVPEKEVRLNRWSNKKSLNPLRESFKFKKFSRKERKFILGLLEKTNCDSGEMKLKDQRWIRLGEILHPGEYKKHFPKSFNAFNKIRNEKVKSWYGLLDIELKKGLENGLKFLSQRPGEFSRRLDWLVRDNPNNIDLIMSHFNQAVQNTSNKVLFEMYEHFEKRMDINYNRSVFIKGQRKPTQLKTLEPLSKETIELIHSKIFESLKEKYSKLEELGNCWIDEELKKIPLPKNMRSMNFASKPLLRGQRTSLDNPEAKVIRPFVHWFDKHGQEDLDLSVTFVGEKNSTVLSFSNMRVGKSIHSGDVRQRQGACAEYIDIDIEDSLSRGYKYVVIDVRNYNGGSLKSVETTFGIMEREFPESNCTWLPETMSNTIGLESESTNTLISIIDLETKEYIMLDIDSDGCVTARGDIQNTLKLVEEYSKPPKVSVYDLILLHVEARGRQVTLDSNVDTYFKLEDFMTSYEKTGKLMGM